MRSFFYLILLIFCSCVYADKLITSWEWSGGNKSDENGDYFSIEYGQQIYAQLNFQFPKEGVYYVTIEKNTQKKEDWQEGDDSYYVSFSLANINFGSQTWSGTSSHYKIDDIHRFYNVSITNGMLTKPLEFRGSIKVTLYMIDDSEGCPNTDYCGLVSCSNCGMSYCSEHQQHDCSTGNTDPSQGGGGGDNTGGNSGGNTSGDGNNSGSGDNNNTQSHDCDHNGVIAALNQIDSSLSVVNTNLHSIDQNITTSVNIISDNQKITHDFLSDILIVLQEINSQLGVHQSPPSLPNSHSFVRIRPLRENLDDVNFFEYEDLLKDQIPVISFGAAKRSGGSENITIPFQTDFFIFNQTINFDNPQYLRIASFVRMLLAVVMVIATIHACFITLTKF